MVWEETEAGVWLDEYDGAEKVFYNMSQAFLKIGKEHGSVHAICKIGIQDKAIEAHLESLLREAWKTLRFDYPALSVVAEGTTKKYLTATAERVEKWAEETFSVNITLTANEIVPMLHLRKLPCLVFLPASSEVIFHCSHWRIDALGTCMVLNRLFDLVSRGESSCSAQWELELQNLSPSLEDAFGSPKTRSPAMEAMAESIRRRNFETCYPSAGLPFDSDITTGPRFSRHKLIELDIESTKSLIAACKARGVSITAAIHAACAQSVFDRSQQNDHDYSTVVSANVRDYLPQMRHGSKTSYVCGTYVTGINHTVRRADDFLTRSSQLTKAYRGDWKPMEYMAALRPIYKVHGEASVANARSGTRLPASNVTVSSLGLVEKFLKRQHSALMIERFHLGSAIMTRQPTLYIWTFRHRLTMSLDYNEAYYSGEAVFGVLESIRTCLEKELDLRLRSSKEAE